MAVGRLISFSLNPKAQNPKPLDPTATFKGAAAFIVHADLELRNLPKAHELRNRVWGVGIRF